MKYVQPELFLEDQFPSRYRSLLPTAIKQAYSAAQELVDDNAILSVESALCNQGRLRSWATDLAIERLIQTGQLPFDYDWASYDKPTGKYLRIRLETSIMSVSLVASPAKPPRKAGFRANNALGNPQFEIFPETVPEIEIEGLPSFVLVHGHTSPDFAQIGMPKPSEDAWGFLSANLMNMPHEIKLADLPPAEGGDDEAVLSLKQELNEWLDKRDE